MDDSDVEPAEAVWCQLLRRNSNRVYSVELLTSPARSPYTFLATSGHFV